MKTINNNQSQINKPILCSAIILFATFCLPLQAYESFEGNQEIVNQFIQLDTDGDGMITKQEVAAQPELTKSMHLSAAGNFEMGDINSDGMLDWDEFLANEEEISAE